MAGSYGNNLKLTIFGESHQAEMGLTLDNLAPGIKINETFIKQCLAKRRPVATIGTSRIEADEFRIISGYYQGHTTGTPLTIIVKNEQQRSTDYAKLSEYYRPSHADYTQDIKYLGYHDPRGGGHFSGRLTVLLVIAGAICLDILAQADILIATHILKSKDFTDDSFSADLSQLKQQLTKLKQSDFPVLTTGETLKEQIAAVKKQQDSIGGILETVVLGLPAGIGEPFFNSLESQLSHLIFSIPAVKGIEFGLGFDFYRYFGSVVNDEIIYEHESFKTKTNHNGGINGGISNGNPLIFKTVIKPTASIGKPQEIINQVTKVSEKMAIEGRHDPAIFPRAAIVIDGLTAFALLDLIYARWGYLWKK